ncbi:glycosyltransferase [Candidatus Parcubacteria bacterium]|nr:MAG: glycosyltransferase [Candidatus Parcubacteria bacterium]
MKQEKIKVLFVIEKLNHGGAERQLTELIKGLDHRLFHVTLVIFQKQASLLSELDKTKGVQIFLLDKKKRLDGLKILVKSIGLIRSANPDVIHSFIGGTNELVLIVAKLLKKPVIWGLRASNLNFSDYDCIHRYIFKLGARLSYFTNLIIVNSSAGRKYYEDNGFSKRRMIVIPNGIDTERYHPDAKAGQIVKEEWGISEKSIIIGMVGRIIPKKDQETFLKAAYLIKYLHNVFFVCIGAGNDRYQRKLFELTKALGLQKKVIWAGLRKEMNSVYNALNILTLSSAYGEGFPNVLGEAMACKIPCVTTDTGDAAYIVDRFGIVVPPRDPKALADGWTKILDLDQNELNILKSNARERIINNFGINRFIASTDAALKSVVFAHQKV